MRVQWLLIPAMTMMMACSSISGELPSAEVDLCLGADGVTAPDNDFEEATWEIRGEVVSDAPTAAGATFNLVDCTSPPTRTLTVLDADSVTWTVGYTLSLEGSDITPPLDLVADDEVEVDFVRAVVWGVDHGVVVRDADSDLLFATQEGWMADLAGMPSDPLGDLEITRVGESGPTEEGGCGTTQGSDLSFSADDDLVLASAERGTVTLDGETLNAVNLASYSFVGQVQCTDTWGPTRWAIWR